MYKENLIKWQNSVLPENLRNEIESLDEAALKEAFYKNLDFGTGGLRGIMGVGTNRINEIVIRKSTQGFANYLNNKFENPSVAISYDNRNNSKEFAYTAARVLAANNIKVYITNELRPTPFLSFLIRHFETSGGIMITASHNPKEYNGYKVYEPHGGQLNLENSEEVIEAINNIEDIFNIKEANNELIVDVNLEELDSLYLEKVKTISLKSFKEPATILYSPLHGTGSTLIPRLLREMNYNYYSFEPHMINDGNFPNTKSANPEEFVAYEDPINFAKNIGADIIILTDPDADRIGVAIKHDDNYQVINGNQLAVLVLYYLLANSKSIKNGYVFMSNVTSSLVEVMAKSYNLNVVKTLPGFKFIAEEINNMKEDSTYVFGCEESNGNIINPFVRDKDAVQAALILSEMASYVKANKMTLIDYLEQVYRKFGYFIEETLSFEFKGLEGIDKMNALMTYLRDNKITIENNDLVVFQDILNKMIYNLKDDSITESTLHAQNIVRFEFADGSWIMARPSGTEPKLKVYFAVKADSRDLATVKLEKHKLVVNNIFKNFI